MLRLLATMTVMVMLGCDGDANGGSGGSCGPFAACGGEVEGEWTVEDVCLDDVRTLLGKPIDDPACQAVIGDVDVRASGTFTFGASGSLTSDLEIEMDLRSVWTRACIESQTGATNIDLERTCAALEDNYAAEPTFAAASCAVAADACECLLTSRPRSSTSASAYVVQGDELVDPSDDSRTPYCATGNTLTLHVVTDELQGRIVLSR